MLEGAFDKFGKFNVRFDGKATEAKLVCSQVVTTNGVTGILEGAFGKSGKFNVRFNGEVQPGDAITLRFKKFVYGDKGRMVQ